MRALGVSLLILPKKERILHELKPADKPNEVNDIVITCMDHRYQEPIGKLLKEKHNVDINHVDRLAIGGSSKGVADGTLMPSIQIAFDKHHARNVWLFDHTDCGGFGGLNAFENDEQKEAQAHFESLDRAQEALHKLLPELLVVTYVIGLDGNPIER
jgi:carbonic anhydrase